MSSEDNLWRRLDSCASAISIEEAAQMLNQAACAIPYLENCVMGGRSNLAEALFRARADVSDLRHMIVNDAGKEMMECEVCGEKHLKRMWDVAYSGAVSFMCTDKKPMDDEARGIAKRMACEQVHMRGGLHEDRFPENEVEE